MVCDYIIAYFYINFDPEKIIKKERFFVYFHKNTFNNCTDGCCSLMLQKALKTKIHV